MITALKNAFSVHDAKVTDGRQNPRFDLSEPCRVTRWGRPFHAMTRNISRGGLCLDIVGMGSSTMDAELLIQLRDLKPIAATACWSHKRTFGMKFADPIEDHPELLAFIESISASK